MKRKRIIELAHEKLKEVPEYIVFSTGIPNLKSLQDFYDSVEKTDFMGAFNNHVKEKIKKKQDYIHKKSEYKSFLHSEEWLSLAKEVRALYGCKCMKCKCINKEMHTDHIIPRSKDRSVELDIRNMQVLCKDCNFEKSNLNSIDYRTPTHIKKLNKYLGVRPLTMTQARTEIEVWIKDMEGKIPESKIKELRSLVEIAGLRPNNYND